VDRERAEQVLAMLERRGEVERLEVAGSSVAATCLARAEERLTAARLLLEARLWPPAYTSAYDAYRMAAEAIVVALGYRGPAVAGAHRITLDIARAAAAIRVVTEALA